MYSNSFPNHSNHSNHSAYNSGPRIISLPHPSVQAPSPQVHPQALALPGTFPLPNQQLNGHHSYLCSPLPTSYYQPLQNRTLYTNLVVSNNRLAAGSDPVRPAAVLGPSSKTSKDSAARKRALVKRMAAYKSHKNNLESFLQPFYVWSNKTDRAYWYCEAHGYEGISLQHFKLHLKAQHPDVALSGTRAAVR